MTYKANARYFFCFQYHFGIYYYYNYDIIIIVINMVRTELRTRCAHVKRIIILHFYTHKISSDYLPEVQKDLSILM